jgi:hypothetical protein
MNGVDINNHNFRFYLCWFLLTLVFASPGTLFLVEVLIYLFKCTSERSGFQTFYCCITILVIKCFCGTLKTKTYIFLSTNF